MSNGGKESTGVDIARGRDYPSIRQFSVFLPNKVGQLLGLMRRIETSKIRVCALSISDSTDCAIIRLVCTQPERTVEILEQGGFAYCEIDLLVVELPNKPQPILEICQRLLEAEINILFCFPLLMNPYGRPALAFYVDNHELAAKTLDQHGFIILTESDLGD